ncbi:hypothetical protein [Mycobacteroides abscessus]|uniref:hypothetical protein n=1 Tax=Mycobacteroides abscessus TaxID=36809 RepID=UPI0009A8AD9A|nr:hypothetical protein [Mycobacteroides abscessus]MDB2211852.1 hypothetical protein [Mycobacteroides abscessus subsp. massiliense]MDB2235298.1 hypothetical protein [Mycobacteroides abscessus subsp. massiliense]WJJ56079.1 hypothetical protein PROPHIT362B_57 [Mycobacterium phage prophiT36-2b]SKO28583.1 Uncharacterised protein [Mycobacteroides abscessus subsp. massiliense]
MSRATEGATIRVRRCACGAHVEYRRSGDEAERPFSRAHYDCEATAIVDDGDCLAAMRALRTVAWAKDWVTGWAVYMGDRAGELLSAKVADRAQAEAVLKLVVAAYDKGASR